MDELSHLIAAAQMGDSEAYTALVQRFQAMAYATAYRCVRDHHLAQDLVQEATIEAFLHIAQLKEPAAFPGWFRQIVFRQCTHLLRRADTPYTSLDAMGESMLTEADPEELTMRSELQAYVRSAVASLPTHERLVTVLFYGYHYSYNEMSTLLKIPLTTVKKRLYSARQRLRVQLQTILSDEHALALRDKGEIAEIIARLLARWANGIRQCEKGKNMYGDIFTFPRTPDTGRTTRRSMLAAGYGS